MSGARPVGCGRKRRAILALGVNRLSSASKITNCQIGVFAAYVSRHGPTFIDRALYLPISTCPSLFAQDLDR